MLKRSIQRTEAEAGCQEEMYWNYRYIWGEIKKAKLAWR